MSPSHADVSVQVAGLPEAHVPTRVPGPSTADESGGPPAADMSTRVARTPATDAPARTAGMPAPAAQVAAQAIAEHACPLAEVLAHVAGKWSIGVIVAAAHGPVRFTEFERAINGISRRMLTLTLRRLERDGLLHRTVYPTVPPKVEYTLTDMARELVDTLAGLTDWAERHRGAITAARAAYDSTN